VHGLIRVEVLPIDQSRRIRIAVEDNGEGMNAETSRQAMEPFFTTKAEGHGNGLGLASVARIIEMADGQITLHSQLGEGTRVELELPCVAAPEITEHALEPEADAIGTLDILVVEDKASVREVTCALLHELGHRTEDCDSSTEGLRSYRLDGPFDLVLSDVRMPGGSGLEFTAQLRDAGFEGPVILFSGYAEDVASSDLEALGAEFLAKPFRHSTLKLAIERAFAGRN